MTPAPAAPLPSRPDTASQTQSAPARLRYLDGLRGLAALMVVLYHWWGGAGNPTLPVRLAPALTVDVLSPIGALGGSRVSLFFVLSGFLLYLPFARRDTHGAQEPHPAPPDQTVTLAGWLGRRFRRLAPPYYAAMLLALFPIAGTFYLNEAWRVWAQHLPPRAPHFQDLLTAFPACLFFLHGLVPGCEKPAFNGALWTLTPEVQLYVAFPLLVALSRWRGHVGKWRIGGIGPAVTLALLASILYRVWLYRQIGYVVWQGDDASLGSQYHCLVNTFLGRWAEFALGMGAAHAIVRGRIPSPRLLVPATVFCFGCFLILRSDLVIDGWIGQLFLAMEPAPSPLADAVGGSAFALLILCCAALPRLAKWLTSAFLVRLGTFAYSLYLIHVPLLWCLHRAALVLLHCDPGAEVAAGKGVAVFAVNVIVGLPLALLAAWGFWQICERPFLSRERERSLHARPA